MAEFDRRRVVPVAGPVLVLLCLVLGLVSFSYQSELDKVVDAYRGAPAHTQIGLRA